MILSDPTKSKVNKESSFFYNEIYAKLSIKDFATRSVELIQSGAATQRAT